MKHISSSKCIEVDSKHYCKECPYEELQIEEVKTYACNHINVVERIVRCEHAELCDHLWNHLLDVDEENNDDDDDDNDMLDDPDWSYAPGVSYEDIR